MLGLNHAGASIAVVANQSGSTRGYFLALPVHEGNERLKREFAQAGLRVDVNSILGDTR